MDINAFIKHIKDTLAQKVKEVPIITNTARQAGNLAPVTPILGRALMTDLQPTIEKYTSPATYDFLNTLLGPLGASKYAPQEQQYFKDLPTGQLSPESKLAGKSLGEQDLISMMGLTRSPTAISTNTLKAVEIQKSIDMMNNKYLTAKGTDKVQLRKAILEAQQMQEAFTARPTADDLMFDERAQAKLIEKPNMSPKPSTGGEIGGVGGIDKYTASLQKMKADGRPLQASEEKWLQGDYSDIEPTAKKLFGVTNDPNKSLYIAKDGQMIGNKGAGPEHRNYSLELTGQQENTSLLPKRSGFIETVYAPGREYNVRVFTDPTPKQIATLKKVIKTVPDLYLDDMRGGKIINYSKATFSDFLKTLKSGSEQLLQKLTKANLTHR
jgi:hypothetical protein